MVYVRILKILGFEIKVQELSIAFSGLIHLSGLNQCNRHNLFSSSSHFSVKVFKNKCLTETEETVTGIATGIGTGTDDVVVPVEMIDPQRVASLGTPRPPRIQNVRLFWRNQIATGISLPCFKHSNNNINWLRYILDALYFDGPFQDSLIFSIVC